MPFDCRPSITRVAGLLTKVIAVGLVVWLAAGCTTLRREVVPPVEAARLDPKSPYLKVHTKSGQAYILAHWSVDSSETRVQGDGVRLGPGRDTVETGNFTIAMDSVALFETNVRHLSPAVAAMAIITGASVALTVYCISNPKACFGSCPTFYASDGSGPVLQAEGFSASIAPSLEATDLDALHVARPRSRDFVLRMENEALETHVVRHVDLKVARKPEDGRVLATGAGELWQTDALTPVASALGPEGDCTGEIRALDNVERVSLTDSSYLGAREHIDLYFDRAPEGQLGLVIASRQTLLTTFLLYQTLAYMGTLTGEWFALMERGETSAKSGGASIGELLGTIEVEVQDETGAWVGVGRAGETGPLARNLHLVLLPDGYDGATPVRLVMTRGQMRLDYVALARVNDPIAPVRLKPVAVRKHGVEDQPALERLLDSARVLVTLPGDSYSLHYLLPEQPEKYELFVESRGYYLEWIRSEWLEEQDAVRSLQVLTNPEGALRYLAPRYKLVEEEMENVFWNSRYARP